MVLEHRRAWRVPALRWVGVILVVFGVMMPLTPASGEKSGSGGAADQEPVNRLSKDDVARMEAAVLRLTNEERSRQGLPELKASHALNYLARIHTEHMCAERDLQHESQAFPAGWRTLRERMDIVGISSAAENVAYRSVFGTGERWSRAVVESWLKSRLHRRNILTSKFRYIGIGVTPCADRIAYVTQVFSQEPGQVPRGAQ